MEKLFNHLSELAKNFHLPIAIAGFLQLLIRKEKLFELKESHSQAHWGDNIPHFIFSDK